METRKTRLKAPALALVFALGVSALSGGHAQAQLEPDPVDAAEGTGQVGLFPLIAAVLFAEAAVGALAGSYVFGLWTGQAKQKARPEPTSNTLSSSLYVLD